MADSLGVGDSLAPGVGGSLGVGEAPPPGASFSTSTAEKAPAITLWPSALGCGSFCVHAQVSRQILATFAGTSPAPGTLTWVVKSSEEKTPATSATLKPVDLYTWVIPVLAALSRGADSLAACCPAAPCSQAPRNGFWYVEPTNWVLSVPALRSAPAICARFFAMVPLRLFRHVPSRAPAGLTQLRRMSFAPTLRVT